MVHRYCRSEVFKQQHLLHCNIRSLSSHHPSIYLHHYSAATNLSTKTTSSSNQHMSYELITPADNPINASTMETPNKPTLNAAGLPRLPLNLRDHKLPIAIQWSLIVLSSGVLPIVGYFALHYGTNLQLKIILSPWLGFMGVTSVFALLKRTWFLVKKDSTCRPLEMTGRWGLDYFGWNFLFGFIVLTILISLGISLENLTIVSLPLSILILYVSLELLLARAAMAMGIRAPFRFSSLARGEEMRPGVYVMSKTW